HAPIGESELGNILRAAKGSETAIVYRVRENQEGLIKMALDLGVDGVFVPRINSAAEAQSAVNAAKYPPLGQRGVGPLRASNYYQNAIDYVTNANRDVTLILQIEHKDAIETLDQILRVKGYDALYVGPADLSASYGVFPDIGHEHVMAAIARVMAWCAKSGMPSGMDTSSAAHLSQMAKAGMQVLTLGGDLDYLLNGARALSAEIRSTI
ncbi:MAG: HpcH/HpaI aldolase family protein, partial [Candidatus Promineifilaceae bacterium]